RRDQQRLQRVVVRVGEVEVRLALGRDRHRGGGHVARAGDEGRARLQTVEADDLDRDVQAQRLRDRGDQVDVEAGVAARARGALELEARIGDVGAHREGARLHEAEVFAGGGLVRAPV